MKYIVVISKIMHIYSLNFSMTNVSYIIIM